MDERTSILIHCCNRLLRELISRMLSKRPEFDVIACDGQPGKRCDTVMITEAHVVVLDSLDAYLQSASAFSARPGHRSLPKCVLVAMADDHDKFLTAVRFGALGYVLQEASASDVLGAIRTVAAGQAVCPPGYTRVLFECVAGRMEGPPKVTPRQKWGLTRREQQLIPLIGRGLTNKEIAAELCLAERTIKNHIHRILKKVGASDRLDLYEVWQSRVVSTNLRIAN